MSEVTVRASSWGALFDCAYRWEGIHLLGIRSHGSPRSVLGNAVHAGTAAFDTARVLGEPISAYDASEALIKTLREPGEDIDWRSSDITLNKAEQIALALHTRYCNQWSPRYEFAAVELKTKPLVIDCGGGQLVRLTGTLDRSRLIATSGKPRIGDVKTGVRAVVDGRAKTAPHRAQVGTYQILYEHTTEQEVDDTAEIIGMKTAGQPEIATGEVKNAKQLMLGTEEHKGLIEIGAAMFRSGLFPPNTSSQLCSAKYCPRWGGCHYHE
jgi:hypothetical protein